MKTKRGRPKTPQSQRTKFWGLRLSPAATARLPVLAEAFQKSPAKVVSQLIEAFK